MNRFTLVGAALALCAGPVAAADYQIETVAEGLSNPWRWGGSWVRHDP